MSVRPFKLPKRLADLLHPEAKAELQRAGQFLEAMQHLKLVVRSGGATVATNIQFSQKAAVLQTSTVTTAKRVLDPETVIWRDRAIAAGGTFTPDSIVIADDLIKAIKRTQFSSKIIYLLPVLGANLATARVPLRDALNRGIAASAGFVEGDFSESTGLQGDGVTKYLDPNIRPSDLGGGSKNGGIGFWDNNLQFSPGTSTVIGAAHNPGTGTHVFTLYLASTETGFEWNHALPGRDAISAAPSTNGHYYGQRSADVLRVLYKSGSLIGQSTVADPADDLGSAQLLILGADSTNVLPGPRIHNGRCAVAYLTDGTLLPGEVSKMHQIITTLLMSPTGRPG